MARLVCPEHGEVNTVSHSGYSLGSFTAGHNGPNERDLEGITFTFNVEELTEDSISLSLCDADNAEDYLEKFSDWEQKVTRAAESEWEQKCGNPNCPNILYWCDDNEEVPDDFHAR